MRPYFEVLQVPNLQQISTEIAAQLDTLIPDRRFRRVGYGFNRASPESLLQASPALGVYLESIGLKEHLGPSGLPWAEPGIAGMVHIDVHWDEGINMPVIGEGYGAWYEAEPLERVKSSKPGSADVSRERGAYIPCDKDNVKELARVSNDLAFWVNTKIPHNGVNTGTVPRVVMCLRFNVPLEKYLTA